MKKVLALAAFAFAGLAVTATCAQPTTVLGALDRPHQTTPAAANTQATGQTHADGQTPATGTQYKKYNSTKMRDAKMSMTAKKEERKEMRMQKKADKAGNM